MRLSPKPNMVSEKNNSTTYALTDITEKIINALGNKRYAYGAFIDLEKAFNTVNNIILLDTFNSFLQVRYQYAKY